jgi:acyl-CoA thioesterase FadM
MIAEHTMTYKKPLKLFERVEMTMSLTHWDDKFFYMSHVFVRGDDLVAEGTSKGAVRARSGRIPPADVIRALEAKQ